jgi:predicted nucleotidyltransferase
MSAGDDIERIIKYFRGRDEVSALYIFGSLAKEMATDESDVDIAVLVNERKVKGRDLARIKEEYYRASPRFSLRPVDIVILNAAPPFLKHQILKTGRILFERNRKFRVRFTVQAITEYLDYKPIQDLYLKAVGERFRRGHVGR